MKVCKTPLSPSHEEQASRPRSVAERAFLPYSDLPEALWAEMIRLPDRALWLKNERV